MLRNRHTEKSSVYRALGVGAAAGLSAGLALSWRMRRARAAAPAALSRLEARVAEALEADGRLARLDIEVGALTDGIVELTGTVRDGDEADRVVGVVQRVTGVRTVLNRMDTELLEEHLAEVRERNAVRGPGERETHWYGSRVGTGMRRQGHETDPARPDDKVPIVSRALGADRAEELTSESLDKLATGVEGHTVSPAAPSDRGTVDEASHRRLGNAPPEPLQELHPESGIHENVRKGTELTLEEAGLEEELIERDLKDRS